MNLSKINLSKSFLTPLLNFTYDSLQDKDQSLDAHVFDGYDKDT